MKLIVGATGVLGSDLTRKLVQNGERVRALVRPQSQAEWLRSLGVEVVRGDLRDPASLLAATVGVDTVVTTATAVLSGSIEAVDRVGYISLIDAARRNGVERFVYTSVPVTLSSSPLIDAKREVEAYLRRSSMVYTVLQPVCFMQSWAGKQAGWDVERHRGMLFGDGHHPVGWVDVRDVADYALESLSNAAAQNADVRISAENRTYAEVHRTFEAVTGQRFRTMRIPAAVLGTGRYLGRVSSKLASALTLAHDIAQGRIAADASDTLKSFKVRPITLEQYVAGLVSNRPRDMRRNT